MVMSETIQQIHVFVSGVVQGVWFRAHTVEKAQQLGLTGWVRNLSDGRVEYVAQGERAKLEALKEWTYTGSPKSNVTQVNTEFETITESFNDFQQKPTL